VLEKWSIGVTGWWSGGVMIIEALFTFCLLILVSRFLIRQYFRNVPWVSLS
jgi:hypothetical protein